MKRILTFLLLILLGSITFAQKKESTENNQKKNQNSSANEQDTNKKKQDSAVVHITPGASGVKRSIGYKFSASTEAGDPGNGLFRYDKENAAEARFLIVDDIDISGEDQTNWYSTWDKTTGATGRGRVTVADTEGKVITVFDFTDVFTDANGFWKLPVEYVSGSLPADGSVYYYVFERIAHSDAPESVSQANQNNQVTEVAQASQGNQAAAAVVATEAVVVAQVNNPPPVVQVEQAIQATDTTKVNQTTQGNQTAVAVVATEAVVVAQANNPPPVVQVEQAIQATDTTKVNQTTQGNQAAVAVVATEAVVVAQANNPPPIVQVEQVTQPPVNQVTTINQAVDTAKSKQVVQDTKVIAGSAVIVGSQTTQRRQPASTTQTPPVTQTTQTKPVTQTTQNTQTTQTTQTKPITQTTQTTQTTHTTSTNPPNQSNLYSPLPTYNNPFSSQRGSGRRWYRGIIEIGYGFGLSDYSYNNFRFNFINGFRIGHFASLGLGIGYRSLFTENNKAPYLVSEKNQLPVFLDFRATLSSKKLTPYLAVDYGGTTGSGSSDTNQNGMFFSASGGLWYNVSDRFAIFAGIAYELMKLQYSDTDPFTDIYRKNAHSLSLNIGISF